MADQLDSKVVNPEESITVDPVDSADGSLSSKEDHIKANAAGRALVEEGNILPLISKERQTTTKWELLAYYLYYAGNTGIGPWNYAPTQLQNVLYLAGYDPAYGPGTPCGDGSCYLKFGGSPKSITAIVLDLSGISFAIEVVISLTLGSTADYGTWRPWICIIMCICSWATGFGWLAVKGGDQWQAAVALYVLGYITYDFSVIYYLAAMPGLVRDLPNMQESETAVLEGRKSGEDHLQLDIMERNRVADYALIWTSFAGPIWLAIGVALLLGVHAERDTASNTWAISAFIAYVTGGWVVCALPWFFMEKRRPGQRLPPGTTYYTVGILNMWHAIKSMWKLKQVMIYLVAYLILSDAQTTIITVIGTLTNTVVSYDIVQLNYMTIVGFGGEGFGIWFMWLIQKRFGLHAKTVLVFNVVCILGLCIWGFIGIWADNIGFKTLGEAWAYQGYFGLLVCQFYQLPYTLISDLVPRPKLFLFWSLFSISGTTSAFIGPFVTSAIIDRSGGNTNMAFAFLLPFCLLGLIILCFVDTEKAVIEAKEFLEQEQRDLYSKEGEVVDNSVAPLA